MLSSLKGSKKKKEKRRRSISASPSISVDPPSSSASSLQDEPSWGTFDEMSMEELSDDEGAILFTEEDRKQLCCMLICPILGIKTKKISGAEVFSGDMIMQWIMSNTLVESKKEARGIARYLFSEGVFVMVQRSTSTHFLEGPTLYRFKQDGEEDGEGREDEEEGEKEKDPFKIFPNHSAPSATPFSKSSPPIATLISPHSHGLSSLSPKKHHGSRVSTLPSPRSEKEDGKGEEDKEEEGGEGEGGEGGQEIPSNFIRFVGDFEKAMLVYMNEKGSKCFSGAIALRWLQEALIASETAPEHHLTEERALQLLQTLVAYRCIVRQSSSKKHLGNADAFYTIGDRHQFFIEALKESKKTRSLGHAFAKNGASPKHPVVILPGFASSSLEVLSSSLEPSWKGERIWLDLGKIPLKVQNFRKYRDLMTLNKKKKEKYPLYDELGNDEDGATRKFLHHLCLSDDGYSDPPGIRVRPMQGLAGVDFLSHSPLTKKASYVFGHVIRALQDVGYDHSNLTACPYDWRLPLTHLEDRDGYFTHLMGTIETMKKINKQPVMVMAHSMGNRVFQYFLIWVKMHFGREWIDEHVHGFLALGGPFLGAPKTIRSLLSGDCMGLELFMELEEAVNLSRRLGSTPALFPLLHDRFPCPVTLIKHHEVYCTTAVSYFIGSIEENSVQMANNWKVLFREGAELRSAKDHRQILKSLTKKAEKVHFGSYDVILPDNIRGQWNFDYVNSGPVTSLDDAVKTEPGDSGWKEGLELVHNFISIHPTFDGVKMKWVGERGLVVGKFDLKFHQSRPCKHLVLGEGKGFLFYHNFKTLAVALTFPNMNAILSFLITKPSENSSSRCLMVRHFLYSLEEGDRSDQDGNGEARDQDGNNSETNNHHHKSRAKLLNESDYKYSTLPLPPPVPTVTTDQPTYFTVVGVVGENGEGEKEGEKEGEIEGGKGENEDKEKTKEETGDDGEVDGETEVEKGWRQAKVGRDELVKRLGEFYLGWVEELDIEPYPEPESTYLNLVPSLVDGEFKYDSKRSINLLKMKQNMKLGKRLKVGLAFDDNDRLNIFRPTVHGLKSKTLVKGITTYQHKAIFNVVYPRNTAIGGLLITRCFFADRGTRYISMSLSKDQGAFYLEIMRMPDKDTMFFRTIIRRLSDGNVTRSYRYFTRKTKTESLALPPSSIPLSSSTNFPDVSITNETSSISSPRSPSTSSSYSPPSSVSSPSPPPLSPSPSSHERKKHKKKRRPSMPSISDSKKEREGPSFVHSATAPPDPQSPNPQETEKKKKKRDKKKKQGETVSTCSEDGPLSVSSLGHYRAVNSLLLVKLGMPITWSNYKQFFVNNPAYLDGKTGSGDEALDNTLSAEMEVEKEKKRQEMQEGEKKGEGGAGKEDKMGGGNYDISPILDILPIKNLFCVFGVNRATEVGYYYKRNKSGKFILDSDADSSSKKTHAINPKGLMIRGGIAYETRTTNQTVCGVKKAVSGDGTVPYASLAYPLEWEKMAKERGVDFNLEVTEIQGSEHRKMLQDESVIINILSYCCYGKRVADL